MSESVRFPLWLAALLVAFAAVAILDRLLLPGARWYLRRRVDRVIDEINRRLRLRIQPFKLTRRAVLVDRLAWDPRVLEAVEAHARESGEPRELAMRRVHGWAREIVPSFNAYAYFRLGFWIARAVARSLYRVRIGFADDDGLSRVDPGASVVFVMNHRSNMDYVLVSYLAAERAALSYAVGEWARIWPLQTLIRSMGAYFIRRSSRDPLYRRVLERYVQMATESGVVQAVFPGDLSGFWAVVLGLVAGIVIGLVAEYYTSGRQVETLANAATTGPARGPLPASSTPAGAEYPRPRTVASKPSNGTALLLGRLRGSGRRIRGNGRRIDGRTFGGAEGRDDDPLLRKPVLLLADARLLPGHLAQVEELRAADVAPLLHLDLFEEGGVDRVGALDADAVRLLADLEGGGNRVPVKADHDPLEILDALLLAFLDPREDPDGVPHVEFREILALLPGFDILEETHGHILSFP